MNLEDLLIAARTIWGEARGEPMEGQRAVAHVILNRAKHEGTSIAAVCLRPRQFSCWNADDPNRALLLDIKLTDPRFRTALRAFLEAMAEPDFTMGARHYHTRAVSPAWSRGRQPDLVVGNHLFFRGIP